VIHKKDRGLLDFLSTIVAVVAVYTGTPWGGLVDRGIAALFDFEGPNKPLISWFKVVGYEARGVIPGVEMSGRPLAATLEQDESLSKVGRKDLSPAIVRAFAVVASSGTIALDESRTPWYDLRPLAHHAQDRASLSLPTFASLSEGESSERTLKLRLSSALDLLAAYKQRLGGIDAALAAYALGLPIAERATSRARLVGAERPATLEAFAPFLTRADSERALAFVNAIRSLSTAYTMLWPLPKEYAITSSYGYRLHPVLGYRKHHDGVDLGAPEGSSIVSAAAGRVVYAKSDGVNGLYVKVDHGYGLATAYCHASKLLVRQGQWVGKGVVLAKVGQTGRATGPHLHYGVFVSGRATDPVLFRPAEMELNYLKKSVTSPFGSIGNEEE